MTKASDNPFPSVLITEGTVPSSPAAGKQRLYIDSTTHHVKRVDSSGTATDIETGTKTFAQLLPLDTFASVGSGDTFAGTSLDSGWSDLQSTAVTSKDRSVANWLILKNTGNTAAQSRGIQRAFSPAGDFSVWAKVGFASMNANYQRSGIFVGATDPSDGASGNRLEVQLLYDGGFHWKFTKFAAGVETSVFEADLNDTTSQLGGAMQFPVWIRIRRSGTTLYAGVSFDGVQFVEYGTTTTISFTVNTCGLHIGEQTATANIRASFNYIVTA